MYQLIIAIQCINIVFLYVEAVIILSSKSSTKLHLYLFFNCCANLINNVGYLLALTSKTKREFLLAGQLSYLGRIWIVFTLFLFVTKLCNVNVPKFIKYALAFINILIYLIILTIPYHKLYYITISFTMEGNFPIFMHTNGIVHHFFMTLNISLAIIGLIIIVKKMFEKSDKASKRRIIMFFLSVITETLFFVIQVLPILPITQKYDITMIGYTIGSGFMLIAIFRYNLLGTEQIAKEYIVDNISDGIVATNLEGKTEYFNEPAKEMFPKIEKESSQVIDQIQEYIAQHKSIHVNDHIYVPKADKIYRSSELIGNIYVLTDSTEMYRHAKELEEMTQKANAANEAKSSFLANMSHDIRTPINAILGMNEMILRESSDTEILSYANNIDMAGKTLLSLINDILDFSKIEEGKIEIIPVNYELNSTINDLVNMIKFKAHNKGLEFKLNVDENTPHLLYGDELRIKQCVTNILSNAVKYTKQGSVEFSVSFDDCNDGTIMLKFCVKDTGIGMKQKDIQKMFSPFQRIEEERNRNIEGTGLGMSITKQLLTLMDSKLDVHSVYGKGSEFSFAVKQKIVNSEPVGNFANRFTPDTVKKEYHELFHAPDAKILVVDDNSVNLTVIKGLLKRTRIYVETIDNGNRALDMAAKCKYDIIFIDHMMPEMDGIETLKRLRELPENKNTICIALTANAISGAKEMYIKSGFSDYLSKPVDPERLEQMIFQYLPKNKIRKTETPEGSIASEDKQEETVLPNKLYEIDELDADFGLKHCGTPETYLETLSVYADTTESNCKEIESLWQSRDINGTTIKVHALKSTSLAIGAENLSELAKKLEFAGKAGDTQTLTAEIDDLINRYKSLGNTLSEILKQKAEASIKPPISKEKLERTYKAIKEFTDNFDIDSAELAIEGLAKYTMPYNETERFERLKKAADDFDWDEVIKIIGGI